MSGGSDSAGSGMRVGLFDRLDDYRWQLEFFDPARWQPSSLTHRVRQWISASRRRCFVVWTTVVVFVLAVIPGAVGAVAVAASGSDDDSSGSSVNSGLSWMNVRDSSGVPLSDYRFVTDHGSLLNPGNTAISLVISLEFAGWLVLVTTAIWLVGYALSFAWLDLFSKALDSVAKTLSRQIATPMLLIVAVTIGAFFVAWFIVRGLHAKATMQVVSMLLVAVMGPIYLAEPLADVLSSDGLLAQGRNVGLAVAAGLNGNSNPTVNSLVPQMQRDMADNFARRPLQVWNYGYVIDSNSACKQAWTSGIQAGGDKAVRSGLEKCDNYAHWWSEHPTVGQIGAGLILLLAAAVLLLFAVYLALRVIKSGLDTVYHGFMAIFGFAAGGFVYGPTQTFLVRNVIDGFIAAARMAVFTIFLGVYVLFLGNLFQQAGDQVMPIFVIGAIVEIVAVFQLRRLNDGLTRGNEWVANRVALAMEGASSRGGGGGGGGTALGMGHAGAGHSMKGMGMLASLGAVSTISNSPATEWIWGRTRSPLRPFSRTERTSALAQWGVWGAPGFGGPTGTYAQSYQNRRLFATAARNAALERGGIDTVAGAAAALQGIVDVGGGLPDAWGAMVGAGFTDENIMLTAIRSLGIVTENAEDETLQDKHLGLVVAAVQRAQTSANRLLRGQGNEHEVAADIATLQSAAFRFRRANAGGVTLDGGNAYGPQRAFVESYMRNPTQERIIALRNVANGNAPGLPELAGIDQQGAARMMRWIGNEHAREVGEAVRNFERNPADPQAIREIRRVVSRATDTDMWSSGSHRTPWNAPQPPGTNTPDPRWAQVFGDVHDRMWR
ncbi:hypothetical protein [Nocardia veterana]|uniref:TrbL/VirB6 plasmid conjugal transfer protein n=1 Tax=Nocardia veterana TaxID=132249 RepID=A0A7X6LZY7_9NOCA|nr:hypothetical protein [Nocardia veterana]NKY87224.1 hypothetical protein [Nocardia veterana]